MGWSSNIVERSSGVVEGSSGVVEGFGEATNLVRKTTKSGKVFYSVYVDLPYSKAPISKPQILVRKTTNFGKENHKFW